jgi:hypothetical protein
VYAAALFAYLSTISAGAIRKERERRHPHPGYRLTLVEQIFSPLLVRAANHPHDVPRSMQAERARLPHEFHVDLAQQVVPFLVIARMATRDQIFPS